MTTHVDHPYTDPGDGRVECETCGKWVHLVIHSCKGVPATPAATIRMLERARDLVAIRPMTVHQHVVAPGTRNCITCGEVL